MTEKQIQNYYKKKNRKSKIYQRGQRINFPEKIKARKLVYCALRSGRLIRKPCVICGSEFSQAHHKDYAKPLEIKWLCATHHTEEHRKPKHQSLN